MVEVMTLALEADENFKPSEALVRIPFIRVPEACPEEQVLFDQLLDLKQELQELADLSNFLLNPEFGIASDVDGFFHCDNSDIFAAHCNQ